MRAFSKLSHFKVIGSLCFVTVLLLVTMFTWLSGKTQVNAAPKQIDMRINNTIHFTTAVTTNVYLPSISNNSSGKVIRVMVSGTDVTQFQEATKAFSEQTGHYILYEGVDDFENTIVNHVQSGQAPDLALFPQPGLLGNLATGGYAMDISNWFAPGYLQQQYDQSWLDMATFNGEMAGVWYRANLKSLVWYPVPEFANAGYQVPQTWAEMIALSDQMVTNGHTPWCIGIESGGATGWPGTDWVEDIMLRTTTPENYDRWTSGELNFSSLEVRDAFVTMGDIWFNEDYVLGGRTAITTTFFGDAPLPMFDNPPGCWLHRQASFIPLFFPAGSEYGIDYDYFYLPPIDSAYGSPVLVAGDIYGVFADRPEIREFVAFLATGESVRAIVEMGGWLSPHNDASLDWYPTDAERGYAEILANADTVRFDGSDLMPAEIGSGAFWQGIVDYVNGKDLDTILSDIDLAWP